MIKAISFDGDDTLWDFESAMRAALQIVLDRLHDQVNDPWFSLSLEQAMTIRDQVADERGPFGPGNTLDDVRRASFEEIARIAGLDSKVVGSELTDLYFESKEWAGQLFPDAERVVATLREKYPVGLLTNGNSSPARFGSPMELDFMIHAEKAGIAKPDPRIFEMVARAAGCTLTELMHVGDSLESDVHGANGVGATSVWLNRNGQANDTGVQPDFEIATLDELPEIVSGFSGD